VRGVTSLVTHASMRLNSERLWRILLLACIIALANVFDVWRILAERYEVAPHGYVDVSIWQEFEDNHVL